ncbi:MAG: SLC45 family MFS transporter [Thermotogaceae bacterium]|nr:SLC45 family MFS transporter [Thermotogaceae bacterium]
MKENKFSYGKIFVLGFGFFGISIIWSIYNAYVPIFLKYFYLSSMAIGFIMTIDNIFAILMLPYIGALSDQTRTKIGRRMPYILAGAPTAAVFFGLIPLFYFKVTSVTLPYSLVSISISKSYAMNVLPWMMYTIIIMNFAMALFRSPVIALMPDITPSKYRSQANGIVNLMGGLGALMVYFAGKIIYDMSPALLFLIGALIMLVANLIVVLFIREPEEFRRPVEGGKIDFSFKKSFSSLGENLKDIFHSKEKSLLFMLLSILFWFVAFNSIETFFTSYAKFYLGMKESTGALILGFFSLSFMLFSIPAGFIGSKIGRKRTITAGLIIASIMVFIALMLKNLIGLMLLFMAGGFGWAMVNVNSLPMVVDMTTKEKVGGYTGLYYFFSMAANIIAPPLSGLFIDMVGYPSLMIFSGVFFILSIITMQFVKRGDVV